MRFRSRYAGTGFVLLLLLLAMSPAQASGTGWVKIETPYFTVLSQWDEAQTQALARDYSRFVAAAAELLGADLESVPHLTVLLFARDRDFAAYAPERAEGRNGLTNAFHARRDGWAVAGLSVEGRDVITIRSLLLHEGTHWLAGADQRLKLPTWLDEGLAQLFETAQFGVDDMTWGAADPRVRAFLRGGTPMPLDRVLTANRSDSMFGDVQQTNAFYAKSWALVHYLLLGRGAPGSIDRLALHRLRDADAVRYLARELDATADEIDSRLRGYLRQNSLPVATQSVAPREPRLEGSLADATVAEIEVGRGRLAFAGGHRRLALEHARRAVAVAEEHPEGYELLALHAGWDVRTREAAAAYARRAMARGSLDPEMAVILGDTLGDHDDASTGTVARARADHYLRALQLRPQQEAVYERLAWALTDADEVRAGDLAAIERGRALYPNSATPLLALTVFAHRRGDVDAERAGFEALARARDCLEAQSQHKLRALRAQWTYAATERQVAVLVAAEQFRDAIDAVDALAAAVEDATLRSSAVSWLESLRIQERLRAADSALRGGRRAEARAIYEQLGARPDLSGDLRQWLVLALERSN